MYFRKARAFSGGLVMPRILAVLAVCSGLLFTTVPIAAHHSFEAEYDRSQKVTLKGTVTKIEWQNPHGYDYVEVADANGAVVNWAIEVGAPNGLYRAGWRKDSLKIGDKV